MAPALRRLEDWPERLMAYIHGESQKDMVWGVNDCLFFTLNGVLAMTGADLLLEYRKRPGGPGTYSTERGGWLALKRRDGTLKNLMTKRLGKPVDWRQARRGDVVLLKVDDPLGETLGLCVGMVSVFRDADGGLLEVPTSEITTAWRVGD